MEYPLLILLILVCLLHCVLVRISIYVVFSTGVNLMNKILAAILCSILSQILLGDCLIVFSTLSASNTDNIYILSGISDYCGLILFQTLSATYFQYRSVLLYKGYAKRFYDYSLTALVIKAFLTPSLSMSGLILSILWNFNILAYITITQIIVAFSNFIYFVILRRKFEEMNMRYMVRSTGATSSINQITHQANTTAQEHYEATKKEIHRNMGITLVAMSIFVVFASILLGVFHRFDHQSGYYISLSYRIAIAPGIMAAIIPIYKKCLEQMKQDKNMNQSLHNHSHMNTSNNNSKKHLDIDDNDE